LEKCYRNNKEAKDMRLLKIGTLNQPNTRWEDALDVFEDIDIFCLDTEERIENVHFHYYIFNNRGLNVLLRKVMNKASRKPIMEWMCRPAATLLRICNWKLIKIIRSQRYDYIHSSYNDFDESAFLTFLLKPQIFFRAQKETRLQYSYLEKWNFSKATRVILNDEKNRIFFEEKYGGNLFSKNQVILGLDEDARSRKLSTKITYERKLSEIDHKIHAVILAGRVLSTPNDSRSGGRLYYYTLILKLLDAGFVVHLHTGNIVPFEGKEPYHQLAEENPNFIIEGKLDFKNDISHAYALLSRYDIGICHAHVPGQEVTEFDKVNIPHRYYEYHLSHVIPVDVKGGNMLLEKKAEEGKAIIVNHYKDLTLEMTRNWTWDTPTFSSYISTLYGESEME